MNAIKVNFIVMLQQINIVMKTYPPIEIEMKEPFYI
jgi:hypothetical protein